MTGGTISPEALARLNQALAGMTGRDPRQAYWQTPRGWMFVYTTERMGDGKFGSAVYVPHGPGSQVGRATRWKVQGEVHHATRTAAKARAYRMFEARLKVEASLRPLPPKRRRRR